MNLNFVKGREQAGQRPVLVISTDQINKLPLVVTVVVGTKGANLRRDYATNVRVPTKESGLPLETVFLCFQVRSLDASRFSQKPAGVISDRKMIEVENAIRTLRASSIRGTKSGIRLLGAISTTIATPACFKFCSYRRFWSAVSRIVNPSEVISLSSAPFFVPAQPISTTV